MGLLAPEEAGRRVRAARKARGMRQAQLAAAMDVAQSLVCNWELGKTPIGREYLTPLSELLDLDLRELLLEDEPAAHAAEV